MAEHNPLARYCIVIARDDTGEPVPASVLRDDVCCPACDDLHTAARLDPDFANEMHDYPVPCPIHGSNRRADAEQQNTIDREDQP